MLRPRLHTSENQLNLSNAAGGQRQTHPPIEASARVMRCCPLNGRTLEHRGEGCWLMDLSVARVVSYPLRLSNASTILGPEVSNREDQRRLAVFTSPGETEHAACLIDRLWRAHHQALPPDRGVQTPISSSKLVA